MAETPENAAPTALPLPAVRSSVATDVALVATFAAFIAVLAILPGVTLPGMAVPITLQTFGVMLAGLVLGPVRGGLAVLLYVAVGAAGLPVFSGGGAGLGVLAGPSGGYLIAFPLAAALAGLLATRAVRLRAVRARTALLTLVLFACAAAASLLLIHPLGISVMGARLGLSAQEAITTGAVFLPGDVIKNVLAAIVATSVFRAFPDMVARRR